MTESETKLRPEVTPEIDNPSEYNNIGPDGYYNEDYGDQRPDSRDEPPRRHSFDDSYHSNRHRDESYREPRRSYDESLRYQEGLVSNGILILNMRVEFYQEQNLKPTKIQYETHIKAIIRVIDPLVLQKIILEIVGEMTHVTREEIPFELDQIYHKEQIQEFHFTRKKTHQEENLLHQKIFESKRSRDLKRSRVTRMRNRRKNQIKRPIKNLEKSPTRKL